MLWQCTSKNLIFLALSNIVNTMLPIGILFLNREALNIIAYSDKTESNFIGIIIILVFIAIANNLVDFSGALKNLFSTLCSNLVSKHLTYLILKKSIDLDLKFYDTDEYYKKLENVKRTFGRRWEFLITAPLDIIGKCVGLLTLVGILASFNILLVPIILLGVSPNIITQLKTRKREMKFITRQIPSTRKMNYTENLLTDRQFAKEVKLFGFGKVIIQLSRELFMTHFKQLMSEKIRAVKLTGFWGFISSFSLLLISVFITYHTYYGRITLGDWQLYISTALSIQTNLFALFNIIVNSYEEDLYTDILMDFLNTEPEIKLEKGIKFPTEETPPTIEFCDVSFFYPNTSKVALSNLNFQIRPGEKIALVGLNGSGKSTIIKLLTRLYDPSDGKILFNGVDIKKYKPLEIYNLFSSVFQDFSKYAFTFRENISISNILNKDDSVAIAQAAMLSGADKIADELPNGFDTYITKSFDFSGVPDLSGGEWQKIAISRAFFRQAPIVILDEPTSALDAEAEYNVYNNFVQLCNNSTAIIISHRLSSVSMADRIFFLKEGQITESGTHYELMNLDGEYARLFKIQAESYKVLEKL